MSVDFIQPVFHKGGILDIRQFMSAETRHKLGWRHQTMLLVSQTESSLNFILQMRQDTLPYNASFVRHKFLVTIKLVSSLMLCSPILKEHRSWIKLYQIVNVNLLLSLKFVLIIWQACIFPWDAGTLSLGNTNFWQEIFMKTNIFWISCIKYNSFQ